MIYFLLQDCCLIPESPFYLEGKGGLLEFIEKRLKDNGHMVIVVAEGAGQDLIAKSMNFVDTQDASGNKLLLDVGLWLSQKIKVRCGPNLHFLFIVGTTMIFAYASFNFFKKMLIILQLQ